MPGFISMAGILEEAEAVNARGGRCGDFGWGLAFFIGGAVLG